jgi:PD-(D/E)XK endonuclease
MRHHTKDKGDEGLGQVIGDLMTHGVHVAVPLSEHLPFDLIAIGEQGDMRRVQVRYRTSLDAAHVRCHLGTSWADRNGTHKRAFDGASIDALAIYCPSPRTFAYLLSNELNASYVNLRFSKAKNGQVKHTRDASEYRDQWRMFAPVTGAGEAATSIGTVADARPHSSADRAAAF